MTASPVSWLAENGQIVRVQQNGKERSETDLRSRNDLR